MDKTVPNFWDQTHPLSSKYNEFWGQMVPAFGNSDSMQGELLRAAGRIGYDWYNNGWGCNNWSGAVVFLQKFFKELPNPSDYPTDEFLKALNAVHDYSHGETVGFADEWADEKVTKIIEYIVSAIANNPTPIPNTRDMFDFQEKDYMERRRGWYEDDEY